MFVRSAATGKESARNAENFHKEINMDYMLDLFSVNKSSISIAGFSDSLNLSSFFYFFRDAKCLVVL
jgi:hypothetical protein